MSGHGPHDPADAKAVDDLTKARFRTEPVEDRSGMFLPPEPVSADATEDERFAAHMERHFGQQR